MRYVCIALVSLGALTMLYSIVKFYHALSELKKQMNEYRLFGEKIYLACFVMMLFFFIGYVIFLFAIFGEGEIATNTLLIALIFFFGAIFVNAMIVMLRRMFNSITDRERLLREKEIAENSSRMMGEFLSRMSHEMRTPMNAIIGMTGIGKNTNDLERKDYCFGVVENASKHLLGVINDVLDMSKIEASKLELSPIVFSFHKMIDTLVSLITPQTEAKHQQMQVFIDEAVPSSICADEQRLRQVMVNLLGNAVKFTTEGHVQLHVTSQIEDDICTLRFSVEDTGIGIKEEDIPKVFMLFQQVDTKKNRSIEGTGLGLHISKQLTEMMGGTIHMQSEYGVGSTFTVSLPQPVANSRPLAALENPESTSVLVYESRIAYLNSIEYALKALGCRYKLCVNRSEMHQCLDASTFDYLFVSSLYVNQIQPLVTQKQPHAVMVVLNSDGNPYYKSNTISITMPIHCLMIANILNETLDNNRAGESSATSITAPDARVLVVDDNAVNLKVAAGLLNIYKIKTDTAISGMQAVRMVHDNDYDLIFMDHMMPDMDGIDTTVAIRSLGEQYKQLPIIALTANAISGVREMFRAEGLDDFLAKPIEILKLNAILKKWLPKDKQQAQEHDIASEPNAIEIPGLNTRNGLVNSGGTPEAYNEILALYASDCEKRLNELAGYHKDGNIRALTICVHALKSSSGNVGADEVAAMATGLENAGKVDDTDYIDANLKRFFDSLSLLLDNIRTYLGAFLTEDEPHKAPDAAMLQRARTRLNTCMNNLDIDGMESVLHELSEYQWDSATAECLARIKESMEIFDYEKAGTAIAQLNALCDTQ